MVGFARSQNSLRLLSAAKALADIAAVTAIFVAYTSCKSKAAVVAADDLAMRPAMMRTDHLTRIYQCDCMTTMLKATLSWLLFLAIGRPRIVLERSKILREMSKACRGWKLDERTTPATQSNKEFVKNLNSPTVYQIIAHLKRFFDSLYKY
ncbi:hypothetical protein QAD02_015355 [Eretmocerus hayati]|uniref:Uncharacterized protein n=1 Tax=Eretmocerus hayati TaxID=131215 RepID=A0ACC2P810_9HYME|nr:hypothetical protein QAD02_015355 [Eretmocerus hayati]